MKIPRPLPSFRRACGVLLGAGLALALPSISSAQDNFAARDKPAAPGELEVMTRGPVHEAFAEAVSYEVEPGLIVNMAPPESIEELPPEQRPEGDSVEWIPGYWAWDEEEIDFLWVSGIWRNLPPERRWVPGYWSDLQDGRWQWTSGYWVGALDKEVAYIVTEPPRSVEAGPNIPAPSDESIWTPGVWSWNENRYAWRPGTWMPLRDDWTWVPARYCWTPRGYVFVDGYWDYAVHRRGVLFAPVRVHRQRGHYADYRYTPSIVVGLEVFLDHLFYRPRAAHYYFGDYYDSRYRNAGWYASFRWHESRRGYDPIYCHQRWQHRNDRDWDHRHRERYDFYQRNVSDRPPHTWGAMKARRGKANKDDRERYYAEPLADFAAASGSSKKFRPLGKGERERIVSQEKEIRKISKQRDHLERGPRDGKGRDGEKNSVERKPLAATSIVGNKLDKADRKGGPPPRPAGIGKADKQDKSTAAKSPGKGSELKGPKPKEERDIRKPDKKSRDAEARPVPKKESNPAPSKEARPIPRKEAKPAPSKEARATPKKEAKSAPSKEARSSPRKESKSVPSKEARPTPRKETKSAPSEKARATPRKETKSAPSKQARAIPRKERKSAPSKQARAIPRKETKSAPSKQARAIPRKETKSAPSKQARATPRKETKSAPSKEVRATPRKEAKSAPQKARELSPSRGKEEKAEKGNDKGKKKSK